MTRLFIISCLLTFSIVFAQVPVPREEIMLGTTHIEAPREIPPPDQVGYYKQNDKYGFVLPGNNRQEAIYDKISSGIIGFIVEQNGLFGIFDKKGTLMGKIEYDSIRSLNNNYLVKKNKKYGLLQGDGKSLLSIKYDRILGGNSISSLIREKNGNTVLVFNQSEKKLPGKVEYANFYLNSAIIKSGGKFGLVTDKIVVPFEYDSIAYNITKNKNPQQKYTQFDFRNIHSTPAFELVVEKNGKLGLVSSEGSLIYPPENDEIIREKVMGYLLAKKDGLFSIYFTSSKQKTAFEFSQVRTDGYGYVMATKNSKQGAFNLKGEEIIPFEYDNTGIYQLSGLGLRVTKDRKKGIISKEGKIIIPPIYDDVNTFYEAGFSNLLKVKFGEKNGIINLKNEIIVPIEFDWIGAENDYLKVVTPGENGKFGLYAKDGKIIIPPEYQWITDSDTERSRITILKKEKNSYNFLNQKNELILPENISEFGYLHDENLLLNPFSSNGKYLVYVKNKNGKFGLLNEITETLDVPMVYDEILQYFEGEEHNYYSVKKNEKFGLINEKNEIIIPISYDDINLDFVHNQNPEKEYRIVAAKGKKFGSVNLKNEVQIPFQYDDLQRISFTELYKAKKDGKYKIIGKNNQFITNDSYDEVANFEPVYKNAYDDQPSFQALTFNRGKMRVINEKGDYVSSEIEMNPHIGFKTFEELKSALILALDSEDDALLKDFSDKIAPSAHLLYLMKNTLIEESSLNYFNQPEILSQIKEKYYNDLLEFKNYSWDRKTGWGYNRSSLTDVTDYTLYKDGLVTNGRNSDHAFGDTRFLEKLLRNSIKINGYWISTYFMIRGFS